MKKILVVTDQRSLNWTSLKEIIPSIEKTWGLLPKNQFKVKKLTIKKTSDVFRIYHQISSDHHIVFTSISNNIAALIKLTRKQNESWPAFTLFLHGDPSTGGLAFRDIQPYLKESDQFVVSCEAEKKALQLCFKKPRITTIPFPVFEKPKKRKATATKEIVYVGRISEQKNLHTLIFSLYLHNLIYSKKVKLTIFGKPDSFGSPNMGAPSKNYFRFLKDLTSKLKLRKEVSWKGFQSEKQIKKYLSKSHVAPVSLSLHTDENFGMAIAKSLLLGHSAKISAWGGHNDFKKAAPHSTLFKVEGSPVGPFINPVSVAKEISKKTKSGRIVKAFDPTILAKKYEKLLRKKSGTKTLKFTPLTQNLLKRRKKLGYRNFKIFSGYGDKLAHPFFKSYGMRQEKTATLSKKSQVYLVPWAKVSGGTITINDPIRGAFKVKTSKSKNGIPLYSFKIQTQVSRKTMKYLLKDGFAFKL